MHVLPLFSCSSRMPCSCGKTWRMYVWERIVIIFWNLNNNESFVVVETSVYNVWTKCYGDAILTAIERALLHVCISNAAGLYELDRRSAGYWFICMLYTNFTTSAVWSILALLSHALVVVTAVVVRVDVTVIARDREVACLTIGHYTVPWQFRANCSHPIRVVGLKLIEVSRLSLYFDNRLSYRRDSARRRS